MRQSGGLHARKDGAHVGSEVHRFLDQTIDLPANLNEAQLQGWACVRCGHEHSDKRPVEAWSEQSAQLFECVDVGICAARQATQHDALGDGG